MTTTYQPRVSADSTDSTAPSADAAVTNMYLLGPFAPVHEEVTVTELAVTGRIPETLDGRYLRNGPNPSGEVDPATYHWFAGDGMVHGVRLRDGRAEWYRNRWVRSPKVARCLGQPEASGPSPVSGDVDFAANTNVIGHAGRIYALVEGGPLPYELTDQLDTVGPCDFDGTLPGGYTAHPHRDPDRGELHTVSYSYFGGNQVQYSVLGTDGRIRRTVDIEVSQDPLMHDFALTENHVVLLDLPVRMDAAKVAAARTATEILAGPLPFRWDPSSPARVGVLPRGGTSSDVRWFEVEPCFVFHPLNAYEERRTPNGPVDRIVMDVVRYETLMATSQHGIDNFATLDRWTIDFASGKVHEERVDDRPQELPRFDERLTGRRHRYGYTAGLASSAVLKHDLAARTTEAHTFEPGDLPGEFVFVPATDTSEEDHGILMGFVYRSAAERSDLVLVDAATLESVATVHLPVRVPFGFHGNWLPA